MGDKMNLAKRLLEHQKVMEDLGNGVEASVHHLADRDANAILDMAKKKGIRFKKTKVAKAKGWKGQAIYMVFHSFADKSDFHNKVIPAIAPFSGPSDPRRDIEKDLYQAWKDKNFKI